jgi:S-formylglutathione hydrolase
LGEDRATWRDYDATELITAKRYPRPILIDQGDQDKFLHEQLQPEIFADAARRSGSELQYRLLDGYDHGYYFISTVMESHLRHHARQLLPA